jgi:hypothetical protein
VQSRNRDKTQEAQLLPLSGSGISVPIFRRVSEPEGQVVEETVSELGEVVRERRAERVGVGSVAAGRGIFERRFRDAFSRGCFRARWALACGGRDAVRDGRVAITVR